MLRSLLLFLALYAVCVGCRSRGNCGTRVPPPGTGSYGAPNTYYPAAGPRASLSGSNESDNLAGGWKNVPDSSISLDSETPTVNSPVTTAAAPRSRLNGMRVNEIKPAVAPASFEAPVTDSDDKAIGTGVNASRPPARPAANQLRGSSASTGSSAWQPRTNAQEPTAPAPNRLAGN